jgi:hypothetical protein
VKQLIMLAVSFGFAAAVVGCQPPNTATTSTAKTNK